MKVIFFESYDGMKHTQLESSMHNKSNCVRFLLAQTTQFDLSNTSPFTVAVYNT